METSKTALFFTLRPIEFKFEATGPWRLDLKTDLRFSLGANTHFVLAYRRGMLYAEVNSTNHRIFEFEITKLLAKGAVGMCCSDGLKRTKLITGEEAIENYRLWRCN